MAGTRPEYAAPPELFYNDDEAVKYTRNSRMLKIQAQITERALELLNFHFTATASLPIGKIGDRPFPRFSVDTE